MSVTTTKQLTAVLGVCLLYVFTRVNTPITVLVPAAHDDGLYMAIGRHLAEGRWLGPYDQFTLLKGPGYPLFLAAGHLLGLPVSLSLAVFHCIAVVFFVAACRPLLKSDFWCAVNARQHEDENRVSRCSEPPGTSERDQGLCDAIIEGFARASKDRTRSGASVEREL